MIKYTVRTLLLIGILSFQACAGLVELDRAQDIFSKGADIENRSAFDFQSFNSLSPSSYYNLAYTEVKEALKNEAKLRRDSVLANAYALKALCEWKLKRYSAADTSASIAIQLFDEYERAGLSMPRDKAVMVALEGLILTDKVNDKLFGKLNTPDADLKDAKAFYLADIHDPGNEKSLMEEAMQIFDNAKGRVRASNAIQTYFLFCQLSSMKVWSDGIDYLTNIMQEDEAMPLEDKMKINELIEQEQDIYLRERNKYLDMLKENLPGKEDNPTYQHWNKIL